MELFFVSCKVKTFFVGPLFLFKASLEAAAFTCGIFPDV
jgi:hypothetical protein